MKIIFFGTPDYVIPILNALYKYYEIIAVVTQSPKAVGRNKEIEYSAVDHWAHKHKIEKLYSFENLPQVDLGVCASYGKIIPKEVINKFKYGVLNIHPSLLPKYRGASPIQTAIANQEAESGVTIIKMDEKMDHGPIVSSFKEDVLINDTFQSLRERLFEKSAEFLINLISNYSKGKIRLKPQDETKATYTKIITKQDGFVDLEKDDPRVVEAKFRAYSPWPGIWTQIQVTSNKLQVTKRLKILEADFDPVTGHLSLVTVQLEGKKPVPYKQFKEAYNINI